MAESFFDLLGMQRVSCQCKHEYYMVWHSKIQISSNLDVLRRRKETQTRLKCIDDMHLMLIIEWLTGWLVICREVVGVQQLQFVTAASVSLWGICLCPFVLVILLCSRPLIVRIIMYDRCRRGGVYLGWWWSIGYLFLFLMCYNRIDYEISESLLLYTTLQKWLVHQVSNNLLFLVLKWVDNGIGVVFACTPTADVGSLWTNWMAFKWRPVCAHSCTTTVIRDYVV